MCDSVGVKQRSAIGYCVQSHIVFVNIVCRVAEQISIQSIFLKDRDKYGWNTVNIL